MGGTLLGDPPFDAVDVGSADGERSYVVRCAEPGFARVLVGPEMLRWVRDLDEPRGYEIHGSLALVYGPPSVGVEGPLERLHAFVNLAGTALTRPGPKRSRRDPMRRRRAARDSRGSVASAGGSAGSWVRDPTTIRSATYPPRNVAMQRSALLR